MAMMANAVTGRHVVIMDLFYMLSNYIRFCSISIRPGMHLTCWSFALRGSLFNRLDSNVKAPDRNADRNNWVFLSPSREFPEYLHFLPLPLQFSIYQSSYHFVADRSRVAQWLRCCATNRKVAGSIPAGVIGNFHWHNPSDRTIALGSTQPLTEMNTMSISCG